MTTDEELLKQMRGNTALRVQYIKDTRAYVAEQNQESYFVQAMAEAMRAFELQNAISRVLLEPDPSPDQMQRLRELVESYLSEK